MWLGYIYIYLYIFPTNSLFHIFFSKRNIRITTFVTIYSCGKSRVVELWTHHFYSTFHNLPRKQVLAKIVVLTFSFSFKSYNGFICLILWRSYQLYNIGVMFKGDQCIVAYFYIIYIYIYMCVCVCVCVWKNKKKLILWFNHNKFWVMLNTQIFA